MKKLLFLGSLGLLLIGCQGEEATELPQDNSATANSQVGFIELCHWDAVTQTFELIAVPQQAVQPHLNHGDALVDADGDGYSAVGSCTGSADDCDDNDPSVYPGNGCEVVLVIAYSNLNGEAGFQEGSSDVLISKLVDFNNDGVVSVGDKVITNQYPKDLDATTFGNFTVKEHSITYVNAVSSNNVMVSSNNNTDSFLWRNWSNAVEFYTEFNPVSFTEITDSLGNYRSFIIVQPLSPSQPADIFPNIIETNYPADDTYIDVDFFL